MADEPEDTSVPPYAPYRTFKTLLRTIASAVPSRIDKHVMPTFSGSIQSQLIQTFKYLRLIDDAGVPSDKLYALLKTLNNQEDFGERMFDLLDGAYSFLSPFDFTTGTDGQLNEAFAKVASGDTARKCKSFYLAALKDAGANLSPYIKEPGRRGPTPGSKRSRPAKDKGQSNHIRSEEQPAYAARPPPSTPSNVHPALLGMLQELPKPGAEWSAAQKEAFTKAFRMILDVVYPATKGDTA